MYKTLLDKLNNDFHVDPFPVPHGQGDPKTAKTLADQAYWDDSDSNTDPEPLPGEADD